jgi:hypothetical protein
MMQLGATKELRSTSSLVYGGSFEQRALKIKGSRKLEEKSFKKGASSFDL